MIGIANFFIVFTQKKMPWISKSISPQYQMTGDIAMVFGPLRQVQFELQIMQSIRNCDCALLHILAQVDIAVLDPLN